MLCRPVRLPGLFESAQAADPNVDARRVVHEWRTCVIGKTGRPPDRFGGGHKRASKQPPREMLALTDGKRVSGARIESVTLGQESAAVVRLYWAEANEGRYGEMRPLIVGGKPGAAVYIRPDVDSLGEDISRRARVDPLLRDTIVYLTCVHELGHALGLMHTSDFRDIMYFFGFGGDIVEYFDRYRRQLRARNDIATVAGVSAADISRLRALYP